MDKTVSLAIRSAPSLSSYSVVACSWGTLISSRRLHRYRTIFPASLAAENSASVELSATVGCNFDLYETTAPDNRIAMPETDRLWEISLARSESMYP